MTHWAGSASEWRRELATAVVVGLFLGAIGPFGTFLNGPLSLRLAYWVGTTVLSLVVYGLGVRGALHLGARAGQPVWFVLPLAVVCLSLPMSVAVAAIATALWPHVRSFVRPVEWYGEVTFMSLAWTIPAHFVRRHFQPPAPASAAAAPAPAGASLLERLPPRLGRTLVCLQMEDHYVRVHTAQGSDLVLTPLKAAMAALGPVEGLQVHRSWWVARAAVVEPVWDGRNLRLRLTNGLEVPVSRSSVADLRARGWLAGGAAPESKRHTAL